MSRLFYCIGDANSKNCSTVCIQDSDCDSQSMPCCKPKTDGSFCVDSGGDFVAAIDCYREMGEAQCEQIANVGSVFRWEYQGGNTNGSIVTANMEISQNDSQYAKYIQMVCQK